jgi:hypothetical protein
MTPDSNGNTTKRPIDPYHSLGLLHPTTRTASRRVPGVLFNESLRQRRAKDVQQIRQDLSATAQLSAAVQEQAHQLAEQTDRLADWLVECGWRAIDALPAWPGLPLPGPLLVGAESTPTEPEQDLLGEDAVVLLRCPALGVSENAEAFDVDAYAKAAGAVVGKDKVHIVDGGDCHYRFVKSLAVQTPNAVALNKPIYSDSEQSSIDALADFFLRSGYWVRLMELGEPGERGIDFANVHWSPAHDLLLLAESAEVGRLPAIALPQLVKAFETPAHVLHIVIKFDAVTLTAPNGLREPACYPLSMFFHSLQNKKGQWVALVGEACVHAVHWLKQDGAVQRAGSLTEVLQEKHFTVVSLSAQDLQSLAACGFSSALRKGVYLVNRSLPKTLRTRLHMLGIEVRVAKPTLGSTNPRHGLFGLNSMVMQVYGELPAPPEADGAPSQDGVHGHTDEYTQERSDL